VKSLRQSGIDLVGNVPWGTHFCQFYQTQQDMLDVLVPYFKTGLLHNEFCMWVTATPLGADDAKAALSAAVPDLLERIALGQIEILPHSEWYLKDGGFDAGRVLSGWVEKLDKALENGWDGLRLTGNTFWLEKDDWQGFTDYERAVDEVIGRYNMLALCTYSLEKCGASEILDVIKNHEFALIKQKGEWQLIENSEHRETRQALQQQQDRLEALYSAMNEGICLHELIYDGSSKPVDYRILDVNPAYEKITGLGREKAIGKKASELYGTGQPPYFDIYERVTRTGVPESFETFFAPMGIHFSISVFSPDKGLFATVFSDVTTRKKSETNQSLLTGVLRVLNRHDSLQALIRDTLRLIRDATSFDAVGLRLRQGDDYPYFKVDGFSDEFLERENFLCSIGGDGAIVKDKDGNPILECTCGLIMSGRTDPSMSCFTPNGSFWTNFSNDLLALKPEDDPRINPRNRCIHTGYQSVGLFPVVAGTEIIGLLQLNGRSPGLFTPDQVNFFEGIARNIGLALQRVTAEEALRQANETLGTRVQERTAELEQAHQEVTAEMEARRKAEETARALSNRLLQVQEAERRNIARELHDEIGQSLTVAKTIASRIERKTAEELRPSFKELSDQLNEIMKQVRNISLSLRPSVLDDMGLVPALKWLGKQLHSQAGLKVNLDCQPIGNLPADVATGVFRVAQEALTNVIRYAGVKEAGVHLSRAGDFLFVCVNDQGCGFDPAALEPGKSVGLSAMRERAALLGGTWECRSAPGEGTAILLTLPIPTDPDPKS